MTTTTNGEEYKLLHQTPSLVKAARVFFLLWVFLIVVPAIYFVATRADSIKEFVVVKAIARVNSVLTEQYAAFSDKLLSEVDIKRYTAKIKVPKIKLDKAEQVAVEQIKDIASMLSKLHLKDAAKIMDTSALLQKRVDDINERLTTTTEQIKKSLNTEIQEGLKKEVAGLSQTQIKKQLSLSDASYQNLISNKYGLISEADRSVTKTIYNELAGNENGIFKDLLDGIAKYYRPVFCVFIALIFIVALIPPFVVMKLAKKFSAVFTQCPYCNKVFMTKKNKLSLIKLFKFW